MFSHILVPLDSSKFAESAIPYATQIATQFGSKLTLTTVANAPTIVSSGFDSASADLYATLRENSLDEAQKYLAHQCKRLRQQGFNVDYRIVEGSVVADKLLELIDDVEADIVVMSTHGRSGLGRWLLGSVADKLIHHASVPVLLIRAQEERIATQVISL